MYWKPYSSLVIYSILASDNPLRFKKNLAERMQKLIMTIDDKTRNEKSQYDSNREAAKILALSSGKIDKYEFATVEEILALDQRRVIEQAKFACSRKTKRKTLEKRGEKIDAIMNQGKKFTALTNKEGDHKDNYKEIFEKIVRERVDEIKNLSMK